MKKERKGTKKYHLMSIYWVPATLVGALSHHHLDARHLRELGTIIAILYREHLKLREVNKVTQLKTWWRSDSNSGLSELTEGFSKIWY